MPFVGRDAEKDKQTQKHAAFPSFVSDGTRWKFTGRAKRGLSRAASTSEYSQ